MLTNKVCCHQLSFILLKSGEKQCTLGSLSKKCNKINSLAPVPFPLCASMKVDKRYTVLQYQASMFSRRDAKLMFIFLSNGPLYMA